MESFKVSDILEFTTVDARLSFSLNYWGNEYELLSSTTRVRIPMKAINVIEIKGIFPPIRWK